MIINLPTKRSLVDWQLINPEAGIQRLMQNSCEHLHKFGRGQPCTVQYSTVPYGTKVLQCEEFFN